VRVSVVFISGNTTDQTTIQGSGFVYNFSSKMVVVTNFHVVRGTTIRSVTFSDGNGYAATILGADAYSDLAVLSVNAPAYEFKPLEIVSSSALRVGVPVIAVGNPFGLVGSMTTGVVSALGRAITEDIMGGFQIGNVIQTSAPINPGNSGGPLLTYGGKVVGITAAIVADSQGLGFAIPSSALLKEIASLIQNGTYDAHSYLGVSGSDMNYDKALGTPLNVTYGWQISQVKSGGPSDGKLAPNDVIIAMNGARIRNGDDLASYLEGNTLPGETATVKVVRLNQTLEVSVVLGKRPPPPV
jgi:S1-C subfamily serine protease